MWNKLCYLLFEFKTKKIYRFLLSMDIGLLSKVYLVFDLDYIVNKSNIRNSSYLNVCGNCK